MSKEYKNFNDLMWSLNYKEANKAFEGFKSRENRAWKNTFFICEWGDLRLSINTTFDEKDDSFDLIINDDEVNLTYVSSSFYTKVSVNIALTPKQVDNFRKIYREFLENSIRKQHFTYEDQIPLVKAFKRYLNIDTHDISIRNGNNGVPRVGSAEDFVNYWRNFLTEEKANDLERAIKIVEAFGGMHASPLFKQGSRLPIVEINSFAGGSRLRKYDCDFDLDFGSKDGWLLTLFTEADDYYEVLEERGVVDEFILIENHLKADIRNGSLEDWLAFATLLRAIPKNKEELVKLNRLAEKIFGIPFICKSEYYSGEY